MPRHFRCASRQRRDVFLLAAFVYAASFFAQPKHTRHTMLMRAARYACLRCACQMRKITPAWRAFRCFTMFAIRHADAMPQRPPRRRDIAVLPSRACVVASAPGFRFRRALRRVAVVSRRQHTASAFFDVFSLICPRACRTRRRFRLRLYAAVFRVFAATPPPLFMRLRCFAARFALRHFAPDVFSPSFD